MTYILIAALAPVAMLLYYIYRKDLPRLRAARAQIRRYRLHALAHLLQWLAAWETMQTAAI